MLGSSLQDVTPPCSCPCSTRTLSKTFPARESRARAAQTGVSKWSSDLSLRWGLERYAHNFAHTARTDKWKVASDSPCKVRPTVVFRAKNARLGGILNAPKSPPDSGWKSGTAA